MRRGYRGRAPGRRTVGAEGVADEHRPAARGAGTDPGLLDPSPPGARWADPGRGADLVRALGAWWWRRQRRGRGRDPGPVSYTHLRAHETRHDLVCRLLLEKKKNTI